MKNKDWTRARGGGLLERGGLFERGGLIEDLRYYIYSVTVVWVHEH